jgi:subtilisin
MVVRGPSAHVAVDCVPLPATGPLGWWHKVLGVEIDDPSAGSGIKAGVADTGHGPHPALAHVVDIGAFVDGRHDPAPAGADVDSHGSHVCGIIGAQRGPRATDFAGFAPGANLHCARVFRNAQSGANQADIANAIDELSRTHQVDLINLSLGSPAASDIEHDAILDAYERGTVCVCAAANSGGPVEYPAKFPESIAISALGMLGQAPVGTLSSTRVPSSPDRFADDNLYLANFSCFGPEIAAAAPGVGIVSTVPARFGMTAPYAAMDGTSMASPVAAGALAVLLSQDANYRALNRDGSRSEAAKQILRRHLRDIGLAPDYEGFGLPKL